METKVTRTQLQDMDDVALIEYARSPAATAAPGLLLLELADRLAPHARTPDDYPFIANEENLK